jgi:Holliday junction resolvase RusA-like endonuclease
VHPTNLVFPVLSPGEAIAIADLGEWSEWITLSLNPCPAPRQSRQTHWAEPKRVKIYHEFRDGVHEQIGHMLGEILPQMNQIQAVFFIPMPKGCYTPKGVLSAEGKRRINQPHLPTPDVDNYTKALADSLFRDSEENDSKIWDERSLKFWSVQGSVNFRWK